MCRSSSGLPARFQSTLPARGATRHRSFRLRKQSGFQSTLPARGATAATAAPSSLLPFQSTLPARGATVKQAMVLAYSDEFQSTLPARGATHLPLLAPPAWNISIHAPRTGSDADLDGHLPSGGDFNPRSPHGERRSQRLWKEYTTCNFNPRSPHGERHGGEWCA